MPENEIMLSIMIETYNQEKYISETLESILKQSYSFPYEIIVGNDCSTDGTAKILDKYALEYPQILVIHNKKNLGAMGNYYNVLSKTNGKYIMDCAGDDYWLPGKVQNQIEYLENHPDVDCIYGKVTGIDGDGNKKAINWGSETEGFDDIFKCIDKIPPATMCFKREIMEQYLKDVKPQEKNWKMEDYPFYLWCSRNKKIEFINQYYASYRILDNSVSHSTDLNKKISFYESIQDVRLFFINKYDLDVSYKQYTEDFHNRSLYHFCINEKKIKDGLNYYQNIIAKTKKDRIIWLLVKLNLYNSIYKLLKRK